MVVTEETVQRLIDEALRAKNEQIAELQVKLERATRDTNLNLQGLHAGQQKSGFKKLRKPGWMPDPIYVDGDRVQIAPDSEKAARMVDKAGKPLIGVIFDLPVLHYTTRRWKYWVRWPIAGRDKAYESEIVRASF